MTACKTELRYHSFISNIWNTPQWDIFQGLLNSLLLILLFVASLRLDLQALVTFLSRDALLMTSLSFLWMCIAASASVSVHQSLTCQALLAGMVTQHSGEWSPKLTVDVSVEVSMTQKFFHSFVYTTWHTQCLGWPLKLPIPVVSLCLPTEVDEQFTAGLYSQIKSLKQV